MVGLLADQRVGVDVGLPAVKRPRAAGGAAGERRQGEQQQSVIRKRASLHG
jgi:hypothetical protein